MSVTTKDPPVVGLSFVESLVGAPIEDSRAVIGTFMGSASTSVGTGTNFITIKRKNDTEDDYVVPAGGGSRMYGFEVGSVASGSNGSQVSDLGYADDNTGTNFQEAGFAVTIIFGTTGTSVNFSGDLFGFLFPVGKFLMWRRVVTTGTSTVSCEIFLVQTSSP